MIEEMPRYVILRACVLWRAMMLWSCKCGGLIVLCHPRDSSYCMSDNRCKAKYTKLYNTRQSL